MTMDKSLDSVTSCHHLRWCGCYRRGVLFQKSLHDHFKTFTLAMLSGMVSAYVLAKTLTSLRSKTMAMANPKPINNDVDDIWTELCDDPDLMDDRREYDVEDLRSAYNLDIDEATNLFDLIQNEY
jgi:hypothetical protein